MMNDQPCVDDELTAWFKKRLVGSDIQFGDEPMSYEANTQYDVQFYRLQKEAAAHWQTRYGFAPTPGQLMQGFFGAEYQRFRQAKLDSQAYIGQCLEHGQSGSSVLVSSVVARIGVANHEAIAACKGAVEALARSAAATYAGKGIRVNAIAPGLMRSPLTERLFAPNAEKQIAAQYPSGRHGSVEDGASAIAWLLSDQSSWVTGQVLTIDGGFSAIRPMVRA